jgi:hypothetical protein
MKINWDKNRANSKLIRPKTYKTISRKQTEIIRSIKLKIKYRPTYNLNNWESRFIKSLSLSNSIDSYRKELLQTKG